MASNSYSVANGMAFTLSSCTPTRFPRPGDEGQHKCTRCKTFVESYDIMVGVCGNSMGIAGNTFWRHVDCCEQHQVLELLVDGEDGLGEVLNGFAELTEDDQDLVTQTLVDLSQGLNINAYKKRTKEGRKEPLIKHKQLAQASPSYATSSSSSSPSQITNTVSPSQTIEVDEFFSDPVAAAAAAKESKSKTLTPWYVHACFV